MIRADGHPRLSFSAATDSTISSNRRGTAIAAAGPRIKRATLGFRAHSQSKLPLFAEYEPMSGITAIDPIALDTGSLPNATVPRPGVPTGLPGTTGGNANSPAVIVSLSSEATTSMQDGPTTLALDPNEVDYALSWAVGVNGFAANAARSTKANVAADGARSNEADVAAVYGTAIAERGTAVVIGAAVGSPSEALYHAANLGIPILESVSPDAARNGASAAAVSVGAFTFTHGGSTYAVTPGDSGTMIGTKDGQAWKTWQRASPDDAVGTGAAAALHPLTSRTAEPTESANDPHVDVSA